MPSIFSKIINGEIGATKIYEDDVCVAILDINPNNKGHALVIPKEEHETILECPDEIMSHLIVIARKIAKKQMEVLKCDGVNVTINNKRAAGQEISHVHIHVIPRYFKDHYKIGFGHVAYNEGEIDKYGEMLKI
jgi:histidine triad (HIT) family protein